MIILFLWDGIGYNILGGESQDSKYPINGIYVLPRSIFIKVNYDLPFRMYVQEN